MDKEGVLKRLNTIQDESNDIKHKIGIQVARLESIDSQIETLILDDFFDDDQENKKEEDK